MAVAVSKDGGLGSLPCVMLDPPALLNELVAMTVATSRPYNVCFFCHTRLRPDEDRQAAWRAVLAPFYAELGVDVGTAAAAPDQAPFSAEAA